MTPCQKMHMQMKHGLPAVFIAVDHRAIPLLGKTFLLGIVGDRQQQLAEQCRVGRRSIVERGQWLLRNEQHMHRCLWVQIAEGQYVVIFVNDIGRDFAPDDLAEDGVAHGQSL